MIRLYFVGVFLFTMLADQYVSPVQNKLTDEDYAVYSAAIDSMDKVMNVDLIVFRETTFPAMDSYNACKGFFDALRAYRKTLFIHPSIELTYFMNNKARSLKLENRFKLSKPYEIITNEEHDDIFLRTEDTPRAMWEHFRSKHPNSSGLIRFSRVGYDPEKTWAIVHVSWNAGVLLGEYTYVVLEKVDGKWIVRKRYLYAQN